MPRFDEGEQNLKLIKGNIVLMGNPDQYGEILAENIFVEDITRAALQTLISGSNLVRGKYYRITNAVGSTLSLVVKAVTADVLDEVAVNSTNGENYKYDITADTAILIPNPIALGTANQVLGVNNAGTAQEYKTISGTANQVSVTNSAGAITLSTPQDIDTNADVVFNSVDVGGLSTQFMKADGSLDSNTYITTISGISASGELSGTYPSPTLVTASVTGKALTGLSISGSAVVSTDSILTAVGKLQNQVNALAGGVSYQGVWNASTNSPSLSSGTGTKGYYYIVDVAGSTNLDGITDWKLGDWAIFNGTTWNKVDNTDAVVSVNGYTGIVTLAAADVGALPTSAISGTTGRLAKFTSSGAVGDSIVSESSSTIIAGSNISGANIRVVSSSYGNNGIFEGYGTDNLLKFQAGALGNTSAYVFANTSVDLLLFAGGVTSMTLKSTGSIITNATTDTGEHFIVGGSMRVNGAAKVINTLGSALTIESTTASNQAITEYISPTRSWLSGMGGSGGYFIFDNTAGQTRFVIKTSGVINIPNIPTSSAGLSTGDIWSNGGVLTIV